jgi:hypothetical protein
MKPVLSYVVTTGIRTASIRLHLESMASSRKPLACTDYHVAWICPLADVELVPARLMLDEEHPIPLYNTHFDENAYICGAINGHNVVIATCPQGETGNVNAGHLTGSMFKSFPNIRMAVLVGIGGGIPRSPPSEDPLHDIHLGDVVVGWPGDGKPACVYHDRGRSKVGGQFEMVGTMQNPDWRLLQALSILASNQEMGRTTFADQLQGCKDLRSSLESLRVLTSSTIGFSTLGTITLATTNLSARNAIEPSSPSDRSVTRTTSRSLSSTEGGLQLVMQSSRMVSSEMK